MEAGLLFLDGGEKTLHVERKVLEGIIVRDCGHRTIVDALLRRVRGDVGSDLLEKIENVAEAKVSRSTPLFGTGFAEEKLG
jgi:hypothetical protein